MLLVTRHSTGLLPIFSVPVGHDMLRNERREKKRKEEIKREKKKKT
jgi:hypothetical protein